MRCLYSSQRKIQRLNESTNVGDEQEQDVQKRAKQYRNWREFTLGKCFNDFLCRNEGQADIIYSLGQRQCGEYSKIFCLLHQQQVVPDIEINSFSEDPREYYFFIEVFKEAVQRKKRDPKDLKIHQKYWQYLRSY